jgi:hypothetical protein
MIANILITISMTAFIVFVFGRFNIMDKLPKYEVFIIKSGLCLVASGSLFNCLTLSNPQISEVILNCGLALTFSWASIFHYKYFVKKNNKK